MIVLCQVTDRSILSVCLPFKRLLLFYVSAVSDRNRRGVLGVRTTGRTSVQTTLAQRGATFILRFHKSFMAKADKSIYIFEVAEDLS